MRQNSILIAGLFIACILCAGIPAVAAAEKTAMQEPIKAPVPAPTATQAAQPVMQSAGQAPWYTPITSVLGFHEQSEQNTQDTGAAGDQKTWWDNIWPLKDTRETTQQVTRVQEQQPADQQPATQGTPQDNAGQQENNNQKQKTNQNMNPEKQPVPANP